VLIFVNILIIFQPEVEADLTNPSVLTTHTIISIDGNMGSGFTTANGVTGGNGTKNNPYIIQDWDINCSTGTGISIRNTEAYFIIRNCYVHDGGYGINLYNVKNGTVINNRGYNFTSQAIILSLSSNNLIKKNNCTNPIKRGWPGIVVSNSYDNILDNNSCSNNGWDGIELGASYNNTLINNSCFNNGWHGIDLRYSYNNTLINNSCFNNGWYGISLENSDNNLIINNTYWKGGWGSLEFDESDSNTIYNNTLINSGIHLDDALNNLFYNNIFINLKIRQDGNNANLWNIDKIPGRNIVNGTHLGGNYWSDYTGSDIDGDGLGDTNLPHGPGDQYPLVDITPPFLKDTTKGTPTTGDPFNITAAAWDNLFLNDIHIDYWYESSYTYKSTMQQYQGTNNNAKFFIIIDIGSSARKLYYNLSVSDYSNNWVSTPIKVLDVFDNDSPKISDHTMSRPTTGDNFTVNSIVKDNIEVFNVTMKYWFDENPENNITMNFINGVHNKIIKVPDNAEVMYYQLSAVDNSSNWANHSIVTLNVTDNDAPLVLDMSGTPTTGDDFLFYFDIQDNFEIKSAVLEFQLDNDETINRIDLPETYQYTSIVPENALELLFTVETADQVNNKRKIEFVKPVLDNDAPEIEDHTSPNPETGMPFLLNFSVTDNIGLENLTFQYWFDKDDKIDLYLNNLSFDYLFEIEMPVNASKLNYNIQAIDRTNNVKTYGKELDIIDILDPEINCSFIPPPTTGEHFILDIDAKDNFEIKLINLEYWFENHSHHFIVYKNPLSILAPLNASKFYYLISAVDENDNMAEFLGQCPVIDNDEPTLIDHSSKIARTGYDFLITSYIEDNVNVSSVIFRYIIDYMHFKINLLEFGPLYSRFIKIPVDVKTFSYNITVIDSSDNYNFTNGSFQVLDVIKPEIAEFSFKSEKYYIIAVEVMDNIEVSSVLVNYWYENATDLNKVVLKYEDLLYWGTIELTSKYGNFYYIIKAIDTSENVNVTSEEIVIMPLFEYDLKPDESKVNPKKEENYLDFGILLTAIIIIIITILGIIMFIQYNNRKKRGNESTIDYSTMDTTQPLDGSPEPLQEPNEAFNESEIDVNDQNQG
jgi:parallel beta-helix repeat protein